MNKNLFFQVLVCIGFLAFCLYSYLDMQNSITELRIKVPSLAKEVRRIEEDNTRLLYEIEAFESPENLLKLASMPEYSHLRHPISADVLTCKVESSGRGADRLFPSRNKRPTVTFATGVNP